MPKRLSKTQKWLADDSRVAVLAVEDEKLIEKCIQTEDDKERGGIGTAEAYKKTSKKAGYSDCLR